MIFFEKTNKCISNGTLFLTCKFVVTYEHSDNEPIILGTPAYWDAAIWDYCNAGYRLFGIYGKKLPHQQCNRITDYKQVWGLLKRPKGRKEAILDFETNRVYLGITEEHPNRLPESNAPICFLIPREKVGYIENSGKQHTFCYTRTS